MAICRILPFEHQSLMLSLCLSSYAIQEPDHRRLEQKLSLYFLLLGEPSCHKLRFILPDVAINCENHCLGSLHNVPAKLIQEAMEKQLWPSIKYKDKRLTKKNNNNQGRKIWGTYLLIKEETVEGCRELSTPSWSLQKSMKPYSIKIRFLVFLWGRCSSLFSTSAVDAYCFPFFFLAWSVRAKDSSFCRFIKLSSHTKGSTTS